MRTLNPLVANGILAPADGGHISLGIGGGKRSLPYCDLNGIVIMVTGCMVGSPDRKGRATMIRAIKLPGDYKTVYPEGTTASQCLLCGEIRTHVPGSEHDEWKYHAQDCEAPNPAFSQLSKEVEYLHHRVTALARAGKTMVEILDVLMRMITGGPA